MKNIVAFKSACGICVALALGALAPQSASAQPAIEPNPQLGIVVTADSSGAGLSITLRASDTSAAAILSLISVKTGAKIVVLQDAPIDSLDVKRASVPDAIRRIAQSAGLKFAVDQGGETYTVGEIKSRPDVKSPNLRFEMNFQQTSASQLVDILSQEFGIKARVDPKAPEKLLDIVMHNTSAIEALQTIADAADLEISVTADGYVLRERADKQLVAKPKLAFKDISTSQLFKTFSEQFGLKIRLAPDLPDKLIDIDVSSTTPEEALKETAQAADFEIEKIDDIYNVRERAVTVK